MDWKSFLVLSLIGLGTIDASGFSLVDSNGNPVGHGVQGLLLWNGGTVCDDSFSDNSANAICGALGHGHHSSWTSGNTWSIQNTYSIAMDDVSCNSGAWSSCNYITSHNCGHHEDVFLACNQGFSLVDSNGNPAGVQGLLLWNGGTVCDDSFNDNAADAICRVLGHDGHSSWRSGQIYSIQSNYDIKMDDVSCSSGAWTSCSYITNHNCGHSEDIHLVCSGPVDGGYTDFGDWSACSASCGDGTQTRTRTCTNPAPANGGADCVGPASETRACKERDCPAFRLVDQNGNDVGARVEGLLLSNGGTVCDDGFSDNSADAICREMGFPGRRSWRNSNQWSSFQATFEITLDDVSCSSGEWSSCTYNFEDNCGHGEDLFLECDGTVDGGYTDFGDWSACSASCGDGTQTRTRTCTNPAPANGGADCVGPASETRACRERDCPEFSLVDQNGNNVGARVEGLLLSNGGTVCDDGFSDNSADAICREMGFPGRFSWRSGNIWTSFQATFEITLDDVSCSSGEWSSCTYNFEDNCGHSEDLFLVCDGTVDGGYTDFGDWSACSASCGDGTQTRTRTCTNPAPANGGADCVGPASETRACKERDCPEFSLVDENGNDVGARVEGLLLSNGGTVCDDGFSDNSADAICREMGFPGRFSWRSGNIWTSFQATFEITLDDVSCSSGEWSSCTYNFEDNCGHGEDLFLVCDGTVDGGYTDFGDWSACSASCGDGTQTRTRTCTNPAPANGGADCVGPASETRACKERDCPEFSLVDQNNNDVGARVEGLLLSNGGTVCDDGFSDNSADAICREMGFIGRRSWRSGNIWTSFQATFEITLDDVSCSSGEWSSCTYNFEDNCGHSEDLFLVCDGPVDGGYTEFGEWSECSNGCGDGTQTRTRTCTNPLPANGGADCVGAASETRACRGDTECLEFSLVDGNGNPVGSGVLGLLLNSGGTVCDDGFSSLSADAICREMGYIGHISYTSGNRFGIQSNFEIKLDDVVCREGDWTTCSYRFGHNCGHHEDIFLQCDIVASPINGGWSDYGDWGECSAVCDGGVQTRTRTCTNPRPQFGGADCVGEDSETRPCNPYPCEGFAIQFEENSSETAENEGLLLYGGGTVCDDHFTDDAAHAICRELGFGKAISWRNGNFWGVIQDRKPIHLDDVQCSADRVWSSCSFSTTHNCGHGEDVFLTCQDFVLVDDEGEPILGQKEGLLLYKSGTVCDTGFSDQSASALCRRLGFYGAKSWRSGRHSPGQQDSRDITMGSVRCSSASWSSCGLTESNSCSHDNDVFLHCYSFDIVDANGISVTDEEEGLLIYKDGTVCDDSFSDNSADAICREMGFHAALSWRNGYFYNVQQTARAIRLDNVACSSNIWAACSYSETHNCNHHEDVHISCELATLRDGGWSDFGDWSECSAECDTGIQTRTRTCTNPTPRYGGAECEGHASETQKCNPYPCDGFAIVDLEGNVIGSKEEGLLLYGGGTVCDDYFNYNAANAICKELGFGAASHWGSAGGWGAIQATKQINLDDVQCSGDGLWSSCSFRTSHNCVHNEDVLLECQRFALVDESGNPVTGHRVEGLLLYHDGTVSGGLSETSANAICREMGYHEATAWRTGLEYGSQQSGREITLSSVVCTSDVWSECSSDTPASGDHNNDVLLSCEYAPVCIDTDGNGYQAGQGYTDDINPQKICTCMEDGDFVCACPADNAVCPGGTSRWTDEETCESRCIPGPAYCSSSGDPHYLSFDGRYFDFHGQCTYQAVSCDDFTVYFKNVDLYRSPIRYTQRMELEFKGHKFVIGRRATATVDGVRVQTPYVKRFTNGDRVELVHNGQLEIRLYSKNRDPSVRMRSNDGHSYINAEIWLHGSCAGITEGLCGNWNGDRWDDLLNNDPNAQGQLFEQYDEDCPAPPPPYDPCLQIGPNARAEAEAICNTLTESPFTPCQNTVPVGNVKEGLLATCVTDVCQCNLDNSCACDQLEIFAQQCIENGVDLSNWRREVEFCPYMCPDGLEYDANRQVPLPSCLDRNPTSTGTQRGCFCPEGQFLQDGACVEPDQCRCLHEGVFYNNGDEIRDEGACQVCTCEDAGEMVCQEMSCPALDCADDELVAYRDDVCCPYCLADWVEAVNPSVETKKGQSVTLTCDIHVTGVSSKNIFWYKDGERVNLADYQLSTNKRQLSFSDAGAEDSGTFTCEATKDGKTSSCDFEVEVIIPVTCTHEDGTEFEAGTTYNPNENTVCSCDTRGRTSCSCIDNPSVQCSAPTGGVWYDEDCNKVCVPDRATCRSYNDPHYKSFDGVYYDFHGRCTYQAASCGDFAVKLKNKDLGGTPTYTDIMTLEFRGHTFAIHSAGYTVRVDDTQVQVPYYKQWLNGDIVSIMNNGQLQIELYSKGREPSARLTARRMGSGQWINVEIDLHGSCAAISEGICGIWDGDSSNEFIDNDVSAHAARYLNWQPGCPEPPPAFHPCDDLGPGFKDNARAICETMAAAPFAQCNNVIPVGNDEGGTIYTCMTEVCNCFGDRSCACPEFDNYAEECISNGVDLSNWRQSVDFCPYDCPEGRTYMANGPVPTPTCLNKDPEQTGTQRGCFCPRGQFLQDDQCVDADECLCLHEGIFYNNGDVIRNEGACQVCTCEDAGEMVCYDTVCPQLSCGSDKLVWYRDDVCCPECISDWVQAVNPEVELVVGQEAVLTCSLLVSNVNRKSVVWRRDGEVVTEGISRNRLELTIDFTDAGTYTCSATKDGVTDSAEFDVSPPPIVPVDGGYTDFGGWSACSRICGPGTQIRRRTCTNPPPSNGGAPCDGPDSEKRECNLRECPVNGGYSDFGDWSECSAECGGGTQTRSRTCTNPVPQHGGLDCVGDSTETRECNTKGCKVDGGYSDFGDWSECSAECDGGTQTRSRTCTNPAPANGGADCVGDSTESRECNTQGCPVDGGYSDFGDWSECSAECDGGTQTRSRTCTNPAPANGGADCVGDSTESRECNTQGCPVDGGYSDFGDWSECSAECDGGTQTRSRTCTNPAPANGGADCVGDSTESRECNTQGCPVDGGYSDFGDWSECSAECGGGTQTRSRTCTNPAPANGGADCVGDSTETRECNTQACAIDGGYSDFGDWSECSAECDGGTQTRSRTCTNPAPANGGADCVGDSTESRECNTQGCPVDGGYTAFGPWSECSVECGGGVRIRTRTCTNPAPANGGSDCEGLGESVQTRECNKRRCPVNGGYSEWRDWTKCTAECGNVGTQKRWRSCNNPAPAFGGANCQELGPRVEVRECVSPDCVIMRAVKPTTLECVIGKWKCQPTFIVRKKNNKVVNRHRVKVCRVVDGKVTDDCVKPHAAANSEYTLRSGRVVEEFAGVYVAVYTEDGIEHVSDPVTVNVS